MKKVVISRTVLIKDVLIKDLLYDIFPYYEYVLYVYLQGRHSNQCHRAMALVVFCLASKPCFKNLPRNYDSLKYIARKPRGLEVALVDFRPDGRPCAYYVDAK